MNNLKRILPTLVVDINEQEAVLMTPNGESVGYVVDVDYTVGSPVVTLTLTGVEVLVSGLVRPGEVSEE